jgi:hypothetical protein
MYDYIHLRSIEHLQTNPTTAMQTEQPILQKCCNIVKTLLVDTYATLYDTWKRSLTITANCVLIVIAYKSYDATALGRALLHCMCSPPWPQIQKWRTCRL